MHVYTHIYKLNGCISQKVHAHKDKKIPYGNTKILHGHFRNHWTYAFKFLQVRMLNSGRFQCISFHSIQGFYFALA